MVRSGGRSSVIHSEAIKSAKSSIAVMLQAIAVMLLSLLRNAKSAEVSDSTNTATATHANMFHPNSMLLKFSFCCVAWPAQEEHERTHK